MKQNKLDKKDRAGTTKNVLDQKMTRERFKINWIKRIMQERHQRN